MTGGEERFVLQGVSPNPRGTSLQVGPGKVRLAPADGLPCAALRVVIDVPLLAHPAAGVASREAFEKRRWSAPVPRLRPGAWSGALLALLKMSQDAG
jgi:hypothetical protein